MHATAVTASQRMPASQRAYNGQLLQLHTPCRVHSTFRTCCLSRNFFWSYNRLDRVHKTSLLEIIGSELFTRQTL